MDIFKLTKRPDAALLFRRDDPNDIRLGEVVKTEPDDYANAEYVLLGLPDDEGVRRNKGRVGAKDAPDAIRKCLYKLVQIEGIQLFDLGNSIIQASLEETHELHREVVRQLLRDGKKVMVMGGGNDTSYPDCSALAMETEGDVLGFNVDAHFDVRADSPRNSGTPYRQLLEEGHLKGENFYEFASQPFANSPTYQRYLDEKQATVLTVDAVRNQSIFLALDSICKQRKDASAIFWGIDMDVVKAGDAPGVSAPNAAGLTAAEFLAVAQFAHAEKRSRIFEITEVNPIFDIDERTCRLAAAALWYFMAGSSLDAD